MGYIPSIGTPPPDSTLSIRGKAADSKTVGDKLSTLNTSLSSTATALKSSVNSLNTNLTGVKNRLVASDGLQFKFGVDSDGYYGYYNASNELVPFSALKITKDVDVIIMPDCVDCYTPVLKQYNTLYAFGATAINYNKKLYINGSETAWDTSENIGSQNGGWGMSFYKKTYNFDIYDIIHVNKASWNYGMVFALGGDTMVCQTYGSSDPTTITHTLQKNCNIIWVVGGAKSMYYTLFKVANISYGMSYNNIGGSSQNSTSGWGQCLCYIMGDFKKGQVFSFTRSSATYGSAIIY